MFIDEITLHMKAGKGGDGVVRWRHEKGKDKGGPSGGNAGKGGDVYALAVRDVGILSSYKQAPVFEAANGADGYRDSKHGEAGADLEVKLPVGSRIKNLTTSHTFELLGEGQKILLLKGGRGGLGNEFFKSSVNIAPTESTEGEAGEEADFEVELLLIVDAGLVGFPNAGKSSLLNALTRAKSKVGNFPFTTLEPSLGELYGLILADIPGLIEGASEGRGLGHKFLRHIERTKAIIHCVSAEDEDVVASYKTIRHELELYNKKIVEKPEIVALTKVDTITPELREEKLTQLRTVSNDVHAVSVIDDELLKRFKDYLSTKLKG